MEQNMNETNDRVRGGLLVALLLAVLAGSYLAAQGGSAPITIQKQGSFAVGGKVLGDEPRTLHCDHGYVE